MGFVAELQQAMPQKVNHFYNAQTFTASAVCVSHRCIQMPAACQNLNRKSWPWQSKLWSIYHNRQPWVWRGEEIHYMTTKPLNQLIYACSQTVVP